MKKFTTSTDNTQIAYEISGAGSYTLLFAHGWLGNKSWWNAQREVFEKNFKIAALDLGGHGESGKGRKNYTASLYADDIAAVARELDAEKLILVGHSMSGAYVLEAAQKVKNLKAIIIIDTLKNLEMDMPAEMLEGILGSYRKDFKNAVENMLPLYLFAPTTPADVRSRLQAEFLTNNGDFASNALEPLYKMDVRSFAKAVSVPVYAINSDFIPTEIEVNKKYFQNYEVHSINGTGHYPMLENVPAFNHALGNILAKFS